MRFEELRRKHPRFVYRSYEVVTSAQGITITYNFLLEPDIWFHPTLTIPHTGAFEPNVLENFVFHLGLIEMISYWKLACPQELVVEAGALTPISQRFMEDLLLHGLGEFYYTNKIDFTTAKFLTITSSRVGILEPIEIDTKPIDLVLVGGGKDSALLLSLLTKSNRTIQPLVINPSVAALEIIKALHLTPIVVTRTMDPKVKELNAQGYG